MALLKDIYNYLKENKAWWLIPTILAFIIATTLIIVATSSTISPFIYALF